MTYLVWLSMCSAMILTTVQSEYFEYSSDLPLQILYNTSVTKHALTADRLLFHKHAHLSAQALMKFEVSGSSLLKLVA